MDLAGISVLFMYHQNRPVISNVKIESAFGEILEGSLRFFSRKIVHRICWSVWKKFCVLYGALFANEDVGSITEIRLFSSRHSDID